MTFFLVLILIFIIFFSELLTYKFIRNIDKKERKKLYDWELVYIKQLSQEKKALKEIEKNKKEVKNDNTDTPTNTNNIDGANVLEPKSSTEDNMQATQ